MPDSVFRIGFTVLDRQIVDNGGELVGKTDDVEFTWEEGRPPTMTALLTDSAALGPRIAGRLGVVWRTMMIRLRPSEHEPMRIPVRDVVEFSPSTHLSTPAPEGSLVGEKWVRENVISRIPGGGK